MKAIALATVATIMTVLVSAVAVQAASRPAHVQQSSHFDGKKLFDDIANQSTQ